MSLYRVDQGVVRNGTVSVTNLPVPDGERVQIVVTDLPAKHQRSIAEVRQLLRRTVEHYDDPVERCISCD